MTHDARKILDQAETRYKRVQPHIRDSADWFHEHEGEMFERSKASEKIADELGIDDDVSLDIVRELISDTVDPIVQIQVKGNKYVGVIEFEEFEGAYGYVDYHDVFGKRNRVVCAQCVHESEVDAQITHATAGEGSFSPGASYSELVEGVHNHYNESHDQIPENVKTGASLVSGTTIGGNTAFHAGNDGSGSAIGADTLDGNHASAFASSSHVGDTTNPHNVTDNQTGAAAALSNHAGDTDAHHRQPFDSSYSKTIVSSNRSSGNWYQNNYSRAIQVVAKFGDGGDIYVEPTTSTTIEGRIRKGAIFTVPKGWYYRIENTSIKKMAEIHP